MTDVQHTADTSGREHARTAARSEFDKWALRYDRSWLNEFVFHPSIRICQEEIIRWKIATAATSYRALDVGCGTGKLLSVLARDPQAELLIGLDYSPVMIEKLQLKIDEIGEEKRRVFGIHGDSEHLPFADQTFDILTCCNSFHHYPNQAAVVAEFKRVLKPRGKMILIDGFRDNVIGSVIFDIGVQTIEKDVHHASWREFREMMESAAFATILQKKVNVLSPLLVNLGTV
ncbi:MAG: class I SAM-dependent methyltransferase [Phycisphaerae bacterium]